MSETSENDEIFADDVPVKAECIHISGCNCQPAAHGVAWEDRLNIICLCGKVCSAVVKRSPTPLLGTTSDDYVARPAAQAFANHLWEMNHPAPAAATKESA